jgi:hypothetical protein
MVSPSAEGVKQIGRAAQDEDDTALKRGYS